jgi:pyruvate dehydrogenase E2 component (dihydrolipoamide acetyltransferase)
MIQEFKLPELGENIVSGTVTRVMLAEGQTVALDQPVIEIETEKAVVEIPSSLSGTVTEVRVKVGQTINIGAVIFVASSEEGAPVKEGEQEVPPPAPQPALERKPADAVASKSKPPAPKRPTLPPQPPPTTPPVQRAATTPALAAPSVRRLAREMGVDINQIPSSDAAGHISVADVRAFAAQQKTAAAPAQPSRAAPEARPDHDHWGELDRQPMSPVRRKTALHIANAWATIPHVTHFDNADVEQLEVFRRQYAERMESSGGKLTITAILVKVLSLALRKFPKFNAIVDMENAEVVLKKYINIGVAVDTEHGLLVPVVKDAFHKGIRELALEIPTLAEKARARKLTIEEMQGGTFTITNLGGIGGTGFTPIINAPEVAILGVSRTRIEPVLRDGAFQPRPILPLALSYDHRLIDGADAARFLRWVVEVVEQPFALLMEHVEE